MSQLAWMIHLEQPKISHENKTLCIEIETDVQYIDVTNWLLEGGKWSGYIRPNNSYLYFLYFFSYI